MTSATPAGVISFYKQILPAGGWTVTDSDEKSREASLEATNGRKRLALTHTVQLAHPTLRFVSGRPGRAITIVTKARVVQSMHEVRDGSRTSTRLSRRSRYRQN